MSQRLAELVRLAEKLMEGEYMGKNIVPLPPTVLKRQIEGECREVDEKSERERAIDRFVDMLVAGNPAFDRHQVRCHVKSDLLNLVNNDTYRLHFEWRYVGTELQPQWKGSVAYSDSYEHYEPRHRVPTRELHDWPPQPTLADIWRTLFGGRS